MPGYQERHGLALGRLQQWLGGGVSGKESLLSHCGRYCSHPFTVALGESVFLRVRLKTKYLISPAELALKGRDCRV